MYNKTRALERTIQNASQFWLMHSIGLDLLHMGSGNWFFITNISKTQATNPSMFAFKVVVFLSSRPPRTIGFFLDISIAGRKCLCVSGNFDLWSQHFDIIILVLMFYLNFRTHLSLSLSYIYIYIYIYIK